MDTLSVIILLYIVFLAVRAHYLNKVPEKCEKALRYKSEKSVLVTFKCDLGSTTFILAYALFSLTAENLNDFFGCCLFIPPLLVMVYYDAKISKMLYNHYPWEGR